MLYIVFSLWLLVTQCVHGANTDLNRCGKIQEDRSVYTSHFDPTNGHTILNIKITTDDSSGYTWQDIVDDTDKYDDFEPFVNCRVAVAGGSWMPCEAERRGDWAMESPLPSLKVKFHDDYQYKGMDRLLLNKHPWDPSRVRAKVTFELLQKVDNMNSLFTQFANVTVNGIYYGLYTLLEDMNEDMLRNHKLGEESNMYKPNEVWWDLSVDKNVKATTDPTYDKDLFEINWDIRGVEEHTALINAYKDVFNPNLDSRTALLNNFNIDNLVFNNYGIYGPQRSAACKWPTPIYHMAWDADGAWEADLEISSPSPHLPLPPTHPFLFRILSMTYIYGYATYNTGIQYFWNLRTVKRFLTVDDFVVLLQQKMEYLVKGPLTPANISALTNLYKPIIKPILQTSPDKENIAWNATIEDWEAAIDGMATIPRNQLRKYPATAPRPMPVAQRMVYSKDRTTLFFYWGKSFIINNKPYFYDFSLAKNESFSTSTIVTTSITNNTYVSVPASSLSPSTTYFWQVIVRSFDNPSVNFMQSYQSLTEESGWGISTFITPASLPPLRSPPTARTITNTRQVTNANKVYTYATLDNVSPTATKVSCSNTPRKVPSGWTFAPNSNVTRTNVGQLKLKWGSSALVLADGSQVASSTGLLIDGFFEMSQQFIEQPLADNSKGYYANCTSTYVKRILIVKL